MSANTRLSEQDRQILQLSKLTHTAQDLIAKQARSSYSISLLMMALQLFKENKLCSTSLQTPQDNRRPEERRAALDGDLRWLGESMCFDKFLNKLSPRVRNKLSFLSSAPEPFRSFLKRSESDIRKYRGIGELAILEINAALYSYGLTMGMNEQEIKEIFCIIE
jgi:hypothetical protein